MGGRVQRTCLPSSFSSLRYGSTVAVIKDEGGCVNRAQRLIYRYVDLDLQTSSCGKARSVLPSDGSVADWSTIMFSEADTLPISSIV